MTNSQLKSHFAIDYFSFVMNLYALNLICISLTSSTAFLFPFVLFLFLFFFFLFLSSTSLSFTSHRILSYLSMSGRISWWVLSEHQMRKIEAFYNLRFQQNSWRTMGQRKNCSSQLNPNHGEVISFQRFDIIWLMKHLICMITIKSQQRTRLEGLVFDRGCKIYHLILVQQ